MGRGDIRALTEDRCSPFLYANQMLSDKQRRERAAVKWRCVWSWHWRPWAGTEGMDKEAFGGTLHSLTAANCFQRKPWNPILETFWVRTKRLFQLCYEFSFSMWWDPSWLRELSCGSRAGLPSHSQNIWVHRKQRQLESKGGNKLGVIFSLIRSWDNLFSP